MGQQYELFNIGKCLLDYGIELEDVIRIQEAAYYDSDVCIMLFDWYRSKAKLNGALLMKYVNEYFEKKENK